MPHSNLWHWLLESSYPRVFAYTYFFIQRDKLGRVLEWSRTIGNAGYDDFSAMSLISGNFLIVSFYTTKPHLTVPSAEDDIEFIALLSQTGEGLKDDQNVLIGASKVLDLVSAGEQGIYMLLAVPKGNLIFLKDSVSYDLAGDSLAIALMGFDEGLVPVLTLLDVIGYPKSMPVFAYLPSRLLLHYSSGLGTPEILLAANVDEENGIGLMIYGYKNELNSNPFLTSSGCQATGCKVCLYVNTDKCVRCNEAPAFYLANGFQCFPTNCPDGYYLASGHICKRCHFTCKSCSGPLSTQCTSCDPSNQVFSSGTGECACSSGKYLLNGICRNTCPSSHIGISSGSLCRETCPSYRFYSALYDTPNTPITMGSSPASEGTDMLEFLPSLTSCLELPGPSGAVALPAQFTISFWIYATAAWIPDTRILLWGFNGFSFKAVNDRVEFILKATDGTEVTTGLSSISMPVNQWFFVAGSVKTTTEGLSARLYSGVSGSPLSETASVILPQPSAKYYNKLLLGCGGIFDPAKEELTTQPESGISAYIREVVYQNRYHSLPSIEAKQRLFYDSCLQIYKHVLSYWRFDSIEEESGQITLKDSSKYKASAVIYSSGSPQKKAGVTNTPQCRYKWEDLGVCVDLFESSGFPKYTLDIDSFAANYLEPRINKNSKEIINSIVAEGDYIRFTFSGCYGEILLEVLLNVETDGSVKVERGKSLPEEVYGKHVDVCYVSPMHQKTMKLGQVYVPLIPSQIYPAHRSSFVSKATSIIFSLTGGDQSKGDVLTLFNMDKEPAAGVSDSIPLYGYILPSMGIRDSEGKFSEISTSLFDGGTYTVVWKPSYITDEDSKKLVAYKNLFTTWAIQEVPKIRFPLVPGIANTYMNDVYFKGELYYPDLQGPGQTDGDELMFCYTSCHYSNHRGQIYQRVNGVYPPVWFGEAFGVANLLTNKLYNRMYVCWRPATTATSTLPGDDNWYPVTTIFQNNEKAFVRVNLIFENEDLPELAATSPSMLFPVLRPGEGVWFKISKCSEYKMKPSSSGGIPGKVQIVHLIYNDPEHSDYETEIIWEQKFETMSDSSENGFTIGNLHGDSSTCKYTLYSLPHERFIRGHSYALIIYSKSFRSAIYNKYLFGDLEPGKPTFKFIFTYQEAIVNVVPRGIAPNENTVALAGNNIGDVFIPGNGFTEQRKLFGVIPRIKAAPDCNMGDISASYIQNSWSKANPTEIVLSGLDFSSCKAEISVDIKFIKLSSIDGKLLWSYTDVPGIVLGEVGCHPSCLECNGTSEDSCTSCHKDSDRPYLYKGLCLSQCGNDLPYSEPVFEKGTYTAKFYRCVKSCSDGTYLNTELGVCLRCNEQCRTCFNDKPMSCLSCKGITLPIKESVEEYNNLFREPYLFEGMCMVECPTITNDISAYHENMVKPNDYLKRCEVVGLPQGAHPISVKVRADIVNTKGGLTVKALLSDVTGNFTKITWGVHPAEDESDVDLYTSDKKVFSTYEKRGYNNLNREINMNVFNYKGVHNELRIVVKVSTVDSMGFDVFELFSNTPSELRTSSLSVQSSNGLATGKYIDIAINETQDTDDYYPVLKYKVLLVPRALAVSNNTKTSMPVSTLSILTQLPPKTLTVYSVRVLQPKEKAVVLKDVFIPPLINGPQSLTPDIVSDAVTCDLLVFCEDRYQGVAKAKISINFTETYKSSARSTFIQQLHDIIMSNSGKELTWDQVLRIAHTLRTISPTPSTYYMTYQYCSRDTHCKNNGKCVTIGGLSQCVCNVGFAGKTCDWEAAELSMARNVTSNVVESLYAKLLTHASTGSDQATVGRNSILDQLANVLVGILENPEALPSEYIGKVAYLVDYMANVEEKIAAKLEDYEKTNMLHAVDTVMKYTVQSLKESMYKLYIQAERRVESIELNAEYEQERSRIAGIIVKIRNALYRLLDRISTGLYPGSAAYVKSFTTFSLFLTSTTEHQLFGTLGKSLAIQWVPGRGYMKLPLNLFDSVRNRVPKNEEFKIRIVEWKENPFIFSHYHSEVCTSVYSLAILDNKGIELNITLTEPVVYFLPFNNFTMINTTEYVRCKYFNASLVQNVTKIVQKLVNVNLVNETEKRKKYPNWNPRVYNETHLIVQESELLTEEGWYPEFVDTDGVSSYGNIKRPEDYVQNIIPCAAYRLGDLAGVVQRKRAIQRPVTSIGFYHYFNSWDAWKRTLGFYVSITLVSMMAASWVLSLMADKALVPRVEKIIEFHRPEYADKDVEMECNKGGNIDASQLVVQTTITQNKTGNDSVGSISIQEEGSGRSQESVEEAKQNSPLEKHRRKRRKNRRKHRNHQVVIAQGEVANSAIMLNNSEAPMHDSKIICTMTNNTSVAQENTTSVAIHTNISHIGEDENDRSKNFKEDIKCKENDTDKANNIFSEEYQLKREIEKFRPLNIYLSSNILVNLLMRTSTLFTRPSRCTLLYVHLFMTLSLCAIAVATKSSKLDHSEDVKQLSTLIIEDIAIIFLVPVASSILMYLYGMLFKLQEAVIASCKNISVYRLCQYFQFNVITLAVN
eukprot:TRINITY_DN4284_c0_g1_i1.p1 TRINITY_DN4284_c0_g1~~TRINITY_DN4284_c0_g1_i1.p1  ORF type:complete len:2525 (-),score=116.44 TRINITY_DN4284_c0_g1_i1:8039-15613(-)